MKNYSSFNYTRGDCQYHVVFIPKRRRSRYTDRSVNTFGIYSILPASR